MTASVADAFDFTMVKQYIADLNEQLKRIRSEREMALQQHEDLEIGPICKLDLLHLLHEALRAVERCDFSNSGPPGAERREMMEALGKRIDALDEEERLLIEQAETTGLKWVDDERRNTGYLCSASASRG